MVPMSEEPGASAPENSLSNPPTGGLTRRQLREQGLLGTANATLPTIAEVAASKPPIVPIPESRPTEPEFQTDSMPAAPPNFDDLLSFPDVQMSKRDLRRQQKAEAKAKKLAQKRTKRSESNIGAASAASAPVSLPVSLPVLPPAAEPTQEAEQEAAAPVAAPAPVVRSAKPKKLSKPPKAAKPPKRPKNKEEPGPRRSGEAKYVAPKRRRTMGAAVFSAVAMAFVAGIAVSTSVPATALLTPEDVSLAAAQQHVGDGVVTTGDSQELDATGNKVVAARDGVTVSAGPKNGKQFIGAYSVNKLKVDVPESSGPVLWPVAELDISSTFGMRNLLYQGEFHTGLDFAPGYGVPIHAVADGIVTEVDNPGPMCGVAVIIDHNINGEKFSSVYCHMQVDSSPLKAGDTIHAGDLVGLIGATGWATGPHLHLEIRVNEQPIDPYAFLLQHAGQPANPGHAG